MENTAFDTPVRVLVGLGMPRDIATPFQAYTFLREMARDRHTVLHAAACESCLSTLTREGTARDARAAFVAYAERAGILAPVLDETIAADNDAPRPMRLAS